MSLSVLSISFLSRQETCKRAVSWNCMKSSAKTSAEYTRFDSAMRTILQVSKTDLNRMLAEEKIANAGKPKRGPKPKTSASATLFR